MNVSELKPCPFCGGAPRKERSSGDERDGYADRVSYTCQSCGYSRGASGDSSKLGQACYHAIQKPGGDSIDLGLYLLKLLEDVGFGVFEVKS